LIIELTIIGYLFLLCSLFYLIVLCAVYIGLNHIANINDENIADISVVIAARNEESRILPCLNSLQKLVYPDDKYEIIFVDDHSTDKTVQIIESYCEKYANWKLICLKEKSKQLRGKKNALLHGIEHARGEIIFTTDADCILPTGWLREMVKYFKPKVSMVLGHSPIQSRKGVWNKILEFDNLFSAISAAAPTKLGYPITSVGRNLAYRRDSYNNVGGFLALKKFRSGDDVHLTERFRYLKNGIVEYCANPDTFVTTQLPDSKKEIFHQQVRKNSKTLKKAGFSIIFSLILFFYHILLILIPIILPSWMWLWLIILLIKLAIEYFNLRKAARIFQQDKIIGVIPLMQIIYPVYIIFFSLLGVLQIYSWKK